MKIFMRERKELMSKSWSDNYYNLFGLITEESFKKFTEQPGFFNILLSHQEVQKN